MGFVSLEKEELEKRGDSKDMAYLVMLNLMDVRDALKRGDAKRAMSLIQKEIRALDRAVGRY